jgi:hypothetical protein
VAEARQNQRIRELIDREPFVPFQIVMNSGDRIRIENPSLVSLDEAWLTYSPGRSNTMIQVRLNQLAFIQIDDLWHD